MTNAGKIHVGDLSTDIQVLIQDTNTSGVNNPVNLALCSTILITMLDPNDAIIGSFNASILDNPGTDGIAHIITSGSVSVWTIGGYYKWFATYTLTGGGTYSTNSAIHEILEAGG